MKEIIGSLQNMIQMCAIIDSGNFPQKIKDDSKRILRESIDFVHTQSDPKTINKLVMDEIRKNYNKKEIGKNN